MRANPSGRRCMILAAAGLLAVVGAPPAPADEAETIVIKAARVHTAAGDPIDSGVIVIRDGRIAAVGRDLPIPAGARVIDMKTGVVTPGLIDACCAVSFEVIQEAGQWVHGPPRHSFWSALGEIKAPDPNDPSAPLKKGTGTSPGSPFAHFGNIELGASPLFQLAPTDTEFPIGPAGAVEALAAAQAPFATWAEHASEVTPHRRVIDSVNLLSTDFERLMKGGVTTVYITPDSASVIGSRGAIVKTAGPLGKRVVRAADAVKASMGGDPSRRGRRNHLPPYYGPTPSFHTRRPTTRMGVDWVFRKALYDARRTRAGQPIYGADMPPEQAIPVLQALLDGEVPLRIQARMQHDIFSALRLASEFGLAFTLEEATEAYRCLPRLKAADVPVIFGPLYMTPTGFRARTDETDRPRLNTPRQLADAGIKFALTAQELRDEEGLARQGMFATRHGLTPEQALRAVTATPAELLGLGGQLGVLAPGAVADLVVWNAEPFDATSRPLLVLVGGRVVFED